jgi:hypothetical protein
LAQDKGENDLTDSSARIAGEILRKRATDLVVDESLKNAIAQALREAERRGMMEAKEDARKPFLTVFLDGRNGHGSHVLPMPGDSIGNERHLRDIQAFLEDQDEGLAERVICEAESMGFEISHCVVTMWRHTDDSDFPGNDYFEYVCVSELLTELFCGSAVEQREAIERAAGEG